MSNGFEIPGCLSTFYPLRPQLLVTLLYTSARHFYYPSIPWVTPRITNELEAIYLSSLVQG